jgi:hypothetical protein
VPALLFIPPPGKTIWRGDNLNTASCPVDKIKTADPHSNFPTFLFFVRELTPTTLNKKEKQHFTNYLFGLDSCTGIDTSEGLVPVPVQIIVNNISM